METVEMFSYRKTYSVPSLAEAVTFYPLLSSQCPSCQRAAAFYCVRGRVVALECGPCGAMFERKAAR